jgi:hypothetical protein
MKIIFPNELAGPEDAGQAPGVEKRVSKIKNWVLKMKM